MSREDETPTNKREKARRPTRVAPPKGSASDRSDGEDDTGSEQEAGAEAPPAPSEERGRPIEASDRSAEASPDSRSSDGRSRGRVAARSNGKRKKGARVTIRKRRSAADRPSGDEACSERRAEDGAPSLRARARARHASGIEMRPSTQGVEVREEPRAESRERRSERPSARASVRIMPNAPDLPRKRSSAPPSDGRVDRRSPSPIPSAPPLPGRPPPEAEGAHGPDPDGRAQPEEGAILITGICGRLGRLLTRKLHRVDRVVGVDRRPFPGKPADVVHHEIDLRRKKTRDVFRAGRIRAVVHLGVLHDPRTSSRDRHTWNVVGFQKLLEYMAQYEVKKLVVLSSANVYGPQPDNPQFLTEEAPLLGSQEFGAIRDLVELDMLAQSYFWRHPRTDTVILRPCHILGKVRNAPSNYLRLERPVTVLGFDPMVQAIHERDVVRAIELALRPGVRGIFNLGGPGELPLSRALERLGRRPVSLPGPLAKAAVEQLWRYRLGSFPSPELDHIRYVCMVDDSRAREVLGYLPRYTVDETLRAVDAPL